MHQGQFDIEQLTPQKLLGNFTRHRLFKCLGAAIGVHVVVIGLASIPFGGRKAAEAPESAAEPAASEASAAASGAAAGGEEAPAAPDEGADMLEKHADSPVVQEISEAAAPEEIPDEPEDLDLSVEDTNF